MNCKYFVRNFRVFDAKGAKLSLRPITILTGCNSSGKSSLVKSLLLFKNYVDLAKKDRRTNGRFCPQSYPLDFTLPGMKLGSVETSRNRNSNIDDPIEISYDVKTYGSLMGFNVSLRFKQKIEDEVNVNAWLDSFTVSSSNTGEVILDVIVDDDNCKIMTMNLNNEEVLGHFLRFYSFSCFRHAKQSSYNSNDDKAAADNFEKTSQEILMDIYSLIPKISQSEADVFDITYENLNTLKSSCILEFDKKTYDTVKKAFDNQILFYLPILEDFKGKNKTEALQILKKYKSDNISQDNKLIDKLIDEFENSCFSNFIDYYKFLEDDKLGKMENRFIAYSHNGDEDFFSFLKHVCLHNSLPADNIVSIEHLFNLFSNIQHYSPNHEGASHFEIQDNIAYSRVYVQYVTFFLYQLEKVLLPEFTDGISYIGNSNTTIQRVYSFEDKDNNLVATIQDYKTLKKGFATFIKQDAYRAICNSRPEWKNYKPGAFTNKWIKEFGLGDSIKLTFDIDGLGGKLLIKKYSEEKSYTSLADEGYGVTQIVILLLRIEIGILNTILKANHNILDKKNLPEEFISSWTLAIEEPEVSLHPSMQSKLALIFEDAYKTYGLNFIIETHSEYLIRKLQTRIASKSLTTNNISIFYFANGAEKTVRMIEMESGGTLLEPFGPGFFDEADNLTLNLLKAKLMF